MIHNTPFQTELNELVVSRDKHTCIHSIVRLNLCQSKKNPPLKGEDLTILSDVYEICGAEIFTRLIQRTNGVGIYLPTEEHWRSLLEVANSFSLRTLQGKSWEEVREVLNDPNIPKAKTQNKINRVLPEVIGLVKNIKGESHNE